MVEEKLDLIMAARPTTELEQGWSYMETGVTKIQRILEGLPEPAFVPEQYMLLYTYVLLYNVQQLCLVLILTTVDYVIHRTIYNMCTQKPPHDYTQELYDRYKVAIDDYNNQTVSMLILASLCLICIKKSLSKRFDIFLFVVRWCLL